MQQQSESGSDLIRTRLLPSLLFCATACFITAGTLLAVFHSEASPKPSQRTLTFAERVTYQRAIEEVYWRHRVWPKEASTPKPSLDGVMSQQQLEKKVADYLRKSQALEDYWQRAITSEQLQAEMDRMAEHTRQPDVLREVFTALGDDPFIIAECLARPALAGRLLTSWYSHDGRIHGELKQCVKADLLAHPTLEQMKQLSGNYSEIELVKADGGKGEAINGPKPGLKLDGRDWHEMVQKLTAIFPGCPVTAGGSPRKSATLRDIKTGAISDLQEDETCDYATAVISKSDDRLTIATVSWLKESLESWLNRAENRIGDPISAGSFTYILPTITQGGCIDDTWRATNAEPFGRFGHTAVWTGNEMIIWGGYADAFPSTGGRYTPGTDTWVPTSTNNAPTGRESQIAVWTGTEMIVWGGYDGGDLNTGGKYNPGTDSWTATSANNAPTGRESDTAVWTGTEMIVWGGWNGSTILNTGGRYNPNTDSWTITSTTNAPSSREYHTAVWTGNEMVIWGGYDGSSIKTGGKYNPNTNSWTATNTVSAPAARQLHTAIWTGTEMVIWGGQSDTAGDLNTGGKYNPITNSWTATNTSNAPEARSNHTAVWAGSQMIIWGGNDFLGDLDTGGRYSPGTNSWTPTTTSNAPEGRIGHTAVWSGSEMIVWSGSGLNTGGRYNPITDSWTPTATAASARSLYTAVWTGTEMIVWGGFTDSGVANTGGKYSPAIDDWAATNTATAPSARAYHTAVWSGSDMIIWGGDIGSLAGLNTGGRYTPGTDSWVATSTTNAPSARLEHTAVWSGTDMIIWGGWYYLNGLNHYLVTGGKYNAGTNSWTATSTNNVPSGRGSPKAVFTGSEMIAWGGSNQFGNLNTGGRYDPVANTWQATSTVNAPTARAYHTAVWSGSEMIIWGGLAPSYSNTGGRYNPLTDNWTATTTSNAPSSRASHTAIWTGSEMIAWGGNASGGILFNTGGRYDPGTDIWTATSVVDAPAARSGHTAVWTGDEMIVWGGSVQYPESGNSGGRYCAQTSGPFTLTAAGRKVQGQNTVRLAWSGATSTDIDVYRNNALVVTTANDGSYTDSTGDTGRARYTYKVCEAGTNSCSNDATVTFRR